MANKNKFLTKKLQGSDKVKQLLPYAVYAVFFMIIMVVYCFIFLNIGDDAHANSNIDINATPLKELIIYAYHHGKEFFCRYWYTVMYYVLRKIAGGILWRPVIGGSYVVAAFAIGKLFPISGESPVKNAVISCFAILLFPMMTMSEAGWLSTSIVYVVPLAFLLVGAIGLKKSFLGQKIHWIGYSFYFFCLYMGTCHEQTSTLFFGLILFMIGYKIYLLIKNRGNSSVKKKLTVNSVYFGLCCILVTYQCYRAITWPSNIERMDDEIRGWFVEYLSLNNFDKLYLGFQDTMYYIITTKPVILTILAVLLCMLIFIMYKDNLYRILGMIPVGIMFVFGIFSAYFQTIFPNLAQGYSSQNVGIKNFINIRFYMSTMISLILILIICINIYLVFQNTYQAVFFAALFCGGLCTRFIMGFSASLYASMYRTAFFLFMTMTVIIFRLLTELRNRSCKKLYPVAVGLVIFFGALSFLDTVLYI